MPASQSPTHTYPAELIAEFARLKQRTLLLLESAAAGQPDKAALIDHLHRLGGAAGLFGEAALGSAAKVLGDRIEDAAQAVRPADYAALAALIPSCTDCDP